MLSEYVREVIRKRLKKYIGGEQELQSSAIKLNQNESEYPTSPKVISSLIEYLKSGDLRRYPEQDSGKLKIKLADVYGLNPEQIVVGNGSDDVIATLFRTVVEENDLVVSTNPTYGMFRIYAAQRNAHYEEVELREDFTLPVDELVARHAKLTAVTNPNSPTGVFTETPELTRLAGELRNSGGVLLVDEAYVEFARDNALRLVDEYNNVLVTRTLSKSHSAAGIRVGFGVGCRPLIGWMEAVKDPYNVGTLHQLAAAVALNDNEYAKVNIERIIQGRRFLSESLERLGLKLYPSEANYVFVKCKSIEDAQRLVEKLKTKNIYIRYFDGIPRIKDCVRITVGTPEINDKFIQAITDILKYT